ncbi:MAG: (Fe-S)-binding protein, partial [Pseudomonadota bacterium]
MNPADLRAALEKCVRCGRCLAVCPVYRLTGWEGSVARGKLSLLRAELAGEADLAAHMKDLLSHCLVCGACAEICANSVKADELIQAGRSLALTGGGLNKLKSLLARDVLSRGPLARGLYRGRRLFLKNVPKESGLHFRFPIPGLDKARWLPQPAEQPFLSRPLPSPPRHRGPRVALFLGCVANYLRPESAEAAVNLLQAAGAEIIIPPLQVCCGKPAAAAGDKDTALYLAQRNLSVFDPDEFDYITAFCATCSSQIKDYATLTGLIQAEELAGKVLDLGALLADVLHWRPQARDPAPELEKVKVFYHDPCHLRRKQGVHSQPRALIRSLPGVELVGQDDPPVCCGYGGIFNLWHYGLSRDIFQKRAETIQAHAPDLVVTNCSGCWLQFEDMT